MPIQLRCPCGRDLLLRDELAGKVVRCPQCRGTVTVPPPVEEVEVLGEAIAAGPPPLPQAGDEIIEVIALEDGVVAGPPRAPSKSREGYNAAPPPVVEKIPEPKKKKKKKSVYSEYYGTGNRDGGVAFEEGWFGSMNSGIIGGACTILLSLLLFAIFLAFGIVFVRAMIYAAILFIVGLIAILKGVFDLQ